MCSSDLFEQRPLILVCHTDKRSAKAAALLSAAGFGRVEVLGGGMVQWQSRRISSEVHHGKDAVHP